MTYTETGLPLRNIVSILVRKEKRRGVAFITLDISGDFRPIGTAFFVEVGWGVNRRITYAVTARHCVAGESDIYLEFSDRDGTYRRIHTISDQWFESGTTDVACCRLMEPSVVQSIDIDMHFMGPYSLVRELESGYDVFTIGLFVQSPYREPEGNLKNITPIVRFGHISLVDAVASVYLSKEDERAKKTTEVSARLIESLAFRGESGSPVFVYEPHTIEHPRWESSYDGQGSYGPGNPFPQRNVLSEADIPTPLLGLISSQWQIDSPIAITHHGFGKAFSKPDTLSGSVALNPAIAVVIPAEAISDFIMNDEQVKEDRERIPKGRGGEPAVGLSAKTDDFTKEDFEAALRKVSRRIEPSKSGEGK